MKTKILKEFDERFNWEEIFGKDSKAQQSLRELFIKAIAQTKEETIREEIAYWIDVFDNRPKNRDLESDNIAQNFARIEIERLENKLKK